MTRKIEKLINDFTLDELLKYKKSLEQFIENIDIAYKIKLSRKINKNLKNKCQIDGDKTCDCYLWCKSKDKQFDSLGM